MHFTRSPLVRIIACVGLTGFVFGCGGPGEDPTDDGPDLSQFTEGVLISGRVLENVTACEVDAVCYLRFEFADTSIVALYGTGERPRPPCDMTKEVSDIAFDVQAGDLWDVVISRCGSEGLYIQQLAPS